MNFFDEDTEVLLLIRIIDGRDAKWCGVNFRKFEKEEIYLTLLYC